MPMFRNLAYEISLLTSAENTSQESVYMCTSINAQGKGKKYVIQLKQNLHIQL